MYVTFTLHLIIKIYMYILYLKMDVDSIQNLNGINEIDKDEFVIDNINKIYKIVKKIDNNYIFDEPKIMNRFRKYLEPIHIDYKTLSNLKYNKENKHFFKFNDELMNVKAYIIRWKRYVDVHDHPDTGCIFKILHGKLRSNLYHRALRYKDQIIYHKGMIDYIDNDIGYHDMENMNIGDYSYSIHVYEKYYTPRFYNTVF